MITLVCDKCERTLEVPDAQAGSKIACPHCGDINVVPGVVGATVRGGVTPTPATAKRVNDRAAAMGLPSELGPEQRVARIHPVVLRSRPVRMLILVVLVLGGGVGAAVLGLRNPPQLLWAGVSGGAAVLGLIILVVWKAEAAGERLEITTKRVTLVRGLLGRESSEIPHEDIQNIQIRQSLWERLWGVGQLGVSSAGRGNVQIVINKIPHPYRVRDMIDAYRNVMN